jgi:transposase-like protein
MPLVESESPLDKEGTRVARVHNCPHCSSSDTFRVHRKTKEYLMLGYRAYLCADCNSRYLVFELGKMLQWRSTS